MPQTNWNQREEASRLREEILDEIERFLNEHGYSPTRAELGEKLGRSDHIIGKHIQVLIEDGRLTEGKGPRTLALPL